MDGSQLGKTSGLVRKLSKKIADVAFSNSVSLFPNTQYGEIGDICLFLDNVAAIWHSNGDMTIFDFNYREVLVL